MHNKIMEISASFIKEATASPRMLEDLAAMERYMSESYDGRTFVELLQNADDANSTQVKVLLEGDTIIVANNGRPFDENDILAICRSGASSKQRGDNIGYRGVGFKSATTISTDIVIHSADAFFSFSKSACAKQLGKNLAQVPTVRIPFLYNPDELSTGVRAIIEDNKKVGFTTFFIFLNAKVDKFTSELDGFNAGWLLFLKQISEVNIACGRFKKSCALTRKKVSDTDTLLSIVGNAEQWYVVSKNNVSLAFKYDSVEGILPCGTDDAVFHCFLPTLDKTGFPFKANADFSTDPSRKHIIQDDSTNNAIYNLQALFAETAERFAKTANEKQYSALSLLTSHTTLNPLVTQFENGLLERLGLYEWVPLNNGQYVSPGNVRTYPKWLDTAERELIFDRSSDFSSKTVKLDFLKKSEKMEALLNKLGATEISISEMAVVLKSADYVKPLSLPLWGKIFVYCYRAMGMNKRSISNLFVPLENGFVPLAETTSDTELNSSFIASVKGLLNAKEAEALSISFDVFSVLQKKSSKNIPEQKQDTSSEGTAAKSTKLAINKWKTPVQNCIAVETSNGNSAKDVSRKCNEYSVISTDADGKEFYIAVKSVGTLGDSFKLTESEYGAAQRLGDSYKVYLFTTDTSNIKYSVIVNPIDSTHMKKVVKEWEWVCTSYDSSDNKSDEEDPEKFELADNTSTTEVDFDTMDGQQFERFCARLLIKNGYEDVSLTKGSGDQGIDIIAYRDGIKYGIQCKCYSSDIGNAAVQEVFAGKTFYKCNIGIVLTNQHFSPSAIQLAETNGIILWGREALLKLIRTSKSN